MRIGDKPESDEPQNSEKGEGGEKGKGDPVLQALSNIAYQLSELVKAQTGRGLEAPDAYAAFREAGIEERPRTVAARARQKARERRHEKDVQDKKERFGLLAPVLLPKEA